MTIVLLLIGLIAIAVGFVTIGFGIPTNQLSFGNTLIEVGSISVATGLILIALAAVLGQLRRINASLQGRGLGRGSESVESLVPPAARMTPAAPPPPVPPRAPAQPRADVDAPPLPSILMPEPPQAAAPRMPELPRMPEPPRAPEPRFPASMTEPAQGSQASAPGPLDWLRAKSKPAAPSMPTPPMPMPAPIPPVAAPSMPAPPVAAEPPVVDVPDEAPLSPRPPQRTMATPVAEQPNSQPMSQPNSQLMPQPEQPRDKDGFDLVWPDRGTAPPATPAIEAAKREPSFGMPLPPIPARPREGKPADRRPPGPAAKVAGERGPAILKSGVIDGMPYTLYADGSIEAELPQGTVKFASVDALRSHLEKQS
jgi:hypothetical protein